MTSSVPPSGVTLWRRIADALESGIADGSYPCGQRLPGETEIAEAHGVNRHTVRRALAALAERGLVRAEQGRGTYVEAPRLPYPLRARTRFSEIAGADGRAPLGRLLATTVEPATAAVARRLALTEGAPTVRIEAVRLADDTPICVGTTWFPAERFPQAGALYGRLQSITKILAHYGVADYRRTTTQVTAALAEPADAVALDLVPGRPVLVVTAVDVDLDGRPVLATRARFAAERVEFVVDEPR